jgi:sigma-B regulation protein RsbU (phosphoserine phosphatase)
MRNHGNQVVGVVQALNKRDGTPFNDYDEELLSALASAGAVAIDNAQLIARDRERQRLERDLELARQIQLGLLPERPPEHPSWRIAAWARSCDETGGDYYDFMPVADGALDAVVGDVSGHGISAALLMSTARAFLRALHERGLPPGETITALNRLLEQDLADDSFMTMVLARLAADGGVQYVSAGHEPPLVWRRDGSFDALDSSGLPVGMLDDSVYEATAVAPLAAGELIVLYTDGIPEAQRPPGHQPFGQELMRSLVAGHAPRGAQAVCDALVAAVAAHLDGHPPHDDITLVVIERR